MWKGCAASASARSAIFAAELAREGMTGPSEAFQGRHGIFEQVTGPFELAPFGGNDRPFAAERSGLKCIPTEYNSQLPLYLVLKLREKVAVEEIASVHVEVYHFTYTEIGSEPEKWRPTTRETADHSLPYMVAVALMDGRISVESFSDARIRDPKLPSLMDRIEISENADFSRRYPASMDCRITIRTQQGACMIEEGSYPKGHAGNPMTDAEVEEKFRDLCRGKMSRPQAQAILDAAWALHAMGDVNALIDLIRVQEA